MLNVDAPLPPALTLRIPAREEVLKHEVKFNAMRWRREIDELGLPELDPRLGRGERSSLSRGDVLRLADEVTSSDDAIQLLYASLAWGLGPKARNLRQRLTGLQSESTYQHLMDAWTAIREGRSPQSCYEVLLTDRGRGRIRWLGPAFATKYLYFATGLHRPPACVILDAVVARNLRPLARPASPTYGWWPATYGQYCHLVTRWARDASSPEHPVWSDQIEKALFDHTAS